MKAPNQPKQTEKKRRWVLFSNGFLHGIERSEVIIFRRKPNRATVRSTVSVLSFSRAFGWLAGLGAIVLLMLLLVACCTPEAQKGGGATTAIGRAGHTNSATLRQSDNPKQASRQTVQSEQTVEYVVPAGSTIQLGEGGGGSCSSGSLATVQTPMPVRIVAKDRTETSIGGAQKDTIRAWAQRASNMQPVMWAGIVMMTLVACALIYFGWWTKGAAAAAIGLGMVVLAHTLPDHGAVILLGGFGLFALVALLVLYAYFKGQLDQNRNGIPDFLEKDREIPY